MRWLLAFPATYHYWRAVRAYKRKEFGIALAHLGRWSAILGAEPWSEAFHGTLLALDQRHEEARQVFQGVIETASALPKPTHTDRYALNYSRYYMAIYSKEEAESFRAAALAITPARYARQCLPLGRL